MAFSKKSFFALIRNEINNEPLPKNIEYDFKTLDTVAQKHDISNLIADALIRNNIVSSGDEYYNFLRKKRASAIGRETQATYFLEKVSGLFTESGIKHIPLKGAIIRELYPEPWMRTSCDIDILVKETDIDKATEILLKNGFATDGKKDYHDIHFYYGKDLHLELHFSICEHLKQIDVMLKRVWDYVAKVGEYEYRETPEYYAFHHIAHMAYHFLEGGCGVRPVIDLWLLRKKGYYEEERLLPLLEQCTLVKFYNSVCKLTEVWMGGAEYDDFTLQIEKYILSGGAFGSPRHNSAVNTIKHKGKFRFLMRIAFPPCAEMCEIYPSLNKCKMLLPFYYIYRVFQKTLGKDRKKVRKTVKGTMMQSKKYYSEISEMFGGLDLKR